MFKTKASVGKISGRYEMEMKNVFIGFRCG